MQALCARCVTLLLKWMVRTIALDVLFQLFLTNGELGVKHCVVLSCTRNELE